MGNYHQQDSVNARSFLKDPDAVTFFARIDYTLKNGGHIQYTAQQEQMWRFLNKHFESVKLYYYDFFSVSLEYGGEASDKYYYLEFLPGTRGGIPLDNRYFLPNEYVIIGFLVYKIIFIDGHIELDSVAALQRMIRQDNEELKPGIYRALAKAKGVNTTHMDDDKVDGIVERALREFSHIGWMEFDGQRFNPLPSFHRLPGIYADYINNPNLWLKDESIS